MTAGHSWRLFLRDAMTAAGGAGLDRLPQCTTFDAADEQLAAHAFYLLITALHLIDSQLEGSFQL